MYLSEIWIYPVKSLGGIRLDSAQVEERGLQYDRRWMIVDENGQFLTQRAIAEMSLLDVAISAEGLRITHRSFPNDVLELPFVPISGQPVSVTVWDDTVDALTVSDEADTWISKYLGRDLRFVIMPESTRRIADLKYAPSGEAVSFADGFPFLLISQASLDDLNTRLNQGVEMRRFRPNFVISETGPYAEDNWREIHIGDLQFEGVKPCARCILTTIDPQTGTKGPEPLKTLSSYRRVNNKVLFGQNLIAKTTGTLRVGDKVSAVSAS